MTDRTRQNIIWQYWETRGEKPAFIDGLHAIARRNAGVPIELVTPETLADHLPDIEPEILCIEDPAHKADMIRSRLVGRHGGMWLDSDALVLRDLSGWFDHLESREFVGFNNGGVLQHRRPWIRVNCFLSRPNGAVVGEWARLQALKLPRTSFRWNEVGSELLNFACLRHTETLAVLPFEEICPVASKDVPAFVMRDDGRAERILAGCSLVMLSNRSLQNKGVPVVRQTVEDLAGEDHLLGQLVRAAIQGPR